MTQSEIFHIVCVANDAYAQHLAVMLTSLFHTNYNKEFRIHILTTDFSFSNEEKIRSIVSDFGLLTVYRIDSIKENIQCLSTQATMKSWNSIMYLKCFLPIVLPSNVDTILFLDVDTVINHDIGPLFELAKTSPQVAIWACEDYKFLNVHKNRLKLKDSDSYVNSGVMIVNLKLWKKMEQELPMSVFIADNKNVVCTDQDVFALYFGGYIRFLPTNQWNATTFFFEQEPRILDKYLPEVDMVRKDPYIIHFCEPVKPWYRDCHHPYQYLYKKYLSQTPWKDYQYSYCGNRMSYSFWNNELKYWLNRWGIRREPMSLVYIKQS